MINIHRYYILKRVFTMILYKYLYLNYKIEYTFIVIIYISLCVLKLAKESDTQVLGCECNLCLQQ